MKNCRLEGQSLPACCAVLSVFRMCVCVAVHTLLGLTDTKLVDGPSVPNVCDYLPVDTE